MQVYEKYISPIGDIVLAADDQGLTCLSFDEKGLETAKEHTENSQGYETEFLDEAKIWPDVYFDGREPGFSPKLHLFGSDFRLDVWTRLLEIHYGTAVS